jgi:ElaB/YqjD/DUF883 family membrane-anchored ribosome-binding protein
MASKDSAAVRDDISDTVGHIGAELRALKSDVARLGQQMAALASATGNDAYRGARRQARRARENLDSAVTEAGEAALDAAENISDTLEDAVNRRPLAALAIAAGVGFVVGAAWRR